MASKPINIRLIRISSQPYRKNMYSIVLQTNLHNFLDKNNKTGHRHLNANKTELIFHIDIREKLSIIRCDK